MPRIARGANRSLESNYFTAFVPNPKLGHMIGHATVGTARSIWRNLKLLVGAKSTPVVHHGLRPPADVPAAPKDNQRPKKRPDAMSRSRETPWDLPQLPLDLVDNAERYWRSTQLASRPWPIHQKGFTIPHAPNASDAFTTRVKDKYNSYQNILPDSVRQSTLLNQAAADYDKVTTKGAYGFKQSKVYRSGTPLVGRPNPEVLSHLRDPKTGFSAGITYDPKRREVVIGFSSLGSAKSTVSQFFRCVMNVTGLFVPKNMSQASKLTKQVKAHIEELNKNLPPDKQIKLTLTGHSMGGGLASYAAMRAKVPAVVFNPMRLGLAARACIGQKTLDQANKYVTEIVGEGDWVADSQLAKAYIPSQLMGLNNRGPVGNARRYMLPSSGVDNAHVDVDKLLNNLKNERQDVHDTAPKLWPYLQATSERAVGELRGGRTRTAIKEALETSAKQSGVRLTFQEATSISKMAEKLIRGKDGTHPLRSEKRDSLFKDLKSKIARIKDGRQLFPALQALEDDISALEARFKVAQQDLNIVAQRASQNASNRPKANKLLGMDESPQKATNRKRNDQQIFEEDDYSEPNRDAIEDEVLEYGSTGGKLNGLLEELGLNRKDIDTVKLDSALLKSLKTFQNANPTHIRDRVTMMIRVNAKRQAAQSADGDIVLQQDSSPRKSPIT